jgi:serine/threonine protein kinase
MASLASFEGDGTPMRETQRLLLAQLSARVGSVVRGKWRIDALLGLGGMAAVYSATHRNGHACAIKMLLPSFSTNPDVIKRFLKEGYVGNEVKHPGVVTVLDDDVTEDGSYFLVMELLKGESFDRRLRRYPQGADPVEVMLVGCEVLDVLAAAHARGIIHRDIKPENIFILEDGRVKVLDFGIAGVRRAQSESARGGTQMGEVMGTPAYMPPEQARGLWDEVDGQSDLWAVGATMYVALTGYPLRVAATTNEELLQAMTVPAPPLHSAKPDLPLALTDVVDRALLFDRQARWPDVRQMRVALQGALGEQAPTMHQVARASGGGPQVTGASEPGTDAQTAAPRPPTASARPPAPSEILTATRSQEAASPSLLSGRRDRRSPLLLGALAAVSFSVGATVVLRLSHRAGVDVAHGESMLGPPPAAESIERPAPLPTTALSAVDAPLAVESLPRPDASATAKGSPPRASAAATGIARPRPRPGQGATPAGRSGSHPPPADTPDPAAAPPTAPPAAPSFDPLDRRR